MPKKSCILFILLPLLSACGSDSPSSQVDPYQPITANADWTPVMQEFDGVEMVLVPVGCFDMGSPDELIDYVVSSGDRREYVADEQPVHEICFDAPFWIDRYEVSYAQFRRLDGQAIGSGQWTDDNLPREDISWFEARDFCVLRGARLPTEAEWEYTARGPDNLIYPWGNEFVAENAVYTDNSGGHSATIGSRPGGVSWVGAYDLSGNVWEWVNTIYQSYPYVATDGRETDADPNSSSTPSRTMRGGAWNTLGIDMRATHRGGAETPWMAGSWIGFRCARAYTTSR